MTRLLKYLFITIIICATLPVLAQSRGRISGKITSTESEIINFASVYLKDTNHGGSTNNQGEYSFLAPAGNYILVVSAMGYKDSETTVTLSSGDRQQCHVVLMPDVTELENVVVIGNGVSIVKNSAYNAVALDARSLHNSTLSLANSLERLPGVKLRESGGVGSDTQFSLDGFSGRHVKFFLDGVPLDGAGASFGINNIPVNFADRIEVYKGVVPVGFGADALGGVVNIVTGNRQRTFIDASYSYGSFNTHKSYVNFGYTAKSGFMFEVNAFQNYSDNSYKIRQNNIANFELKPGATGENSSDWNVSASKSVYETVKRFNDTYHNETIVGKIGVVGKSWADRLVLGVTLAQSYKEIQNGVKQEVVYGEKHRKSDSFMPTLQYVKRNLFTRGLDISLSANYNLNKTHNIDTSALRYNWRGESIPAGSPGEQTYQNAKFDNDNWNGTFNASYRFAERHSIVFNHVISGFDRKATENATSSGATSTAAVPKSSRKNISGLSYRFQHEKRWNVSLFGKYYNQSSKGPVNTSSSGGYDYVQYSKEVDVFGYGAAGTYFWGDLQAKLSYEKAYRLPTTDELFGDEDLEKGAEGLLPERSNNFNVNLSYGRDFGPHSIFIEAGWLYRDTKDYIRRTLEVYSGGLNYAQNENHGRVKTEGISAGFRYSYADKFSVGGNLTSQNIRDHERFATSNNTVTESLTYKMRIPNVPYFFWNTDASYYIRNLGAKGNLLTLSYDNLYVKSFPREWAAFGDEKEMMVPTQFSHNFSVIYSIKNGRYNFSLECRNFTNERVYDNYSLQKAGRAFYGKIRVFFGK